MLQHHLRSVSPGLEVPASLELEEVPLGADDRTSFEPVQEAESRRDRGITHVPSPSFRKAPDDPVPVTPVAGHPRATRIHPAHMRPDRTAITPFIAELPDIVEVIGVRLS